MAKGTCSVPGCTKPEKARGWCGMHHERQRRHGTLDNPRLSPEELFWAKVNKGDGTGCWLWTCALTRGYGSVGWKGRTRYAHLVAYELLVGPVPKGKELDHVKANGCTSTACVKAIADEFGPAHLEPVTKLENIRRAAAARNHCPRGHPYDMFDGSRRCRRCRLEQQRRNHRERKIRKEASSPTDEPGQDKPPRGGRGTHGAAGGSHRPRAYRPVC